MLGATVDLDTVEVLMLVVAEDAEGGVDELTNLELESVETVLVEAWVLKVVVILAEED